MLPPREGWGTGVPPGSPALGHLSETPGPVLKQIHDVSKEARLPGQLRPVTASSSQFRRSLALCCLLEPMPCPTLLPLLPRLMTRLFRVCRQSSHCNMLEVLGIPGLTRAVTHEGTVRVSVLMLFVDCCITQSLLSGPGGGWGLIPLGLECENGIKHLKRRPRN